jgi:hypothetical protein
MAINSVVASDNFASGSLAAGWVAVPTLTTGQIVSNIWEPSSLSTNQGVMWTGTTFPNHQISECTINLTPNANSDIYLFTRLQNAGQWSGYAVGLVNTQANIQRFDNGVNTVLVTTGAGNVTYTSGDVITFEAAGSSLTLYQNNKFLLHALDTTYTGGSPGFGGFTSVSVGQVQVLSWRGYSGVQQDGVWTKRGVVLGATSVDTYPGVTGPFVIYDSNAQLLSGSVYKMWFQGGGPATTINVYYAESADGLSWTRRSSAVLASFQSAAVVKLASTYYMVTQADGGGNLQLYSSSDGISWSVVSSNILSPGTAGQWDNASFYTFAAPVLFNGTWYLFYNGLPSGSTNYNTGVATASAITGPYTKSGSNPLFVGVPTTPVQVGSTWYMWCPTGPTASQGATSNSDPSNGVRHSSTDLINWSISSVSVHNGDFVEGINTLNAGIYPNCILDISGKATMYVTSAPLDTLAAPYYQISAAQASVPIAKLVTAKEDAVIQLGSDNFARAAGGLGGSWTTPGSTTGLQIASSGVVEAGTTNTNCVSYFNGSFAAAQYAEVTLLTLGTGSYLASPTVYQQSSGLNCYYATVISNTGALHTVTINKFVSGASTAISPAVGFTQTVGDVLRLAVYPGNDGYNVLCFYQNGHLIVQTQDPLNVFTSGNPGAIMFAVSTIGNAQISAWAGGNANSLPTYSSTSHQWLRLRRES